MSVCARGHVSIEPTISRESVAASARAVRQPTIASVDAVRASMVASCLAARIHHRTCAWYAFLTLRARLEFGGFFEPTDASMVAANLRARARSSDANKPQGLKVYPSPTLASKV